LVTYGRPLNHTVVYEKKETGKHEEITESKVDDDYVDWSPQMPRSNKKNRDRKEMYVFLF